MVEQNHWYTDIQLYPANKCRTEIKGKNLGQAQENRLDSEIVKMTLECVKDKVRRWTHIFFSLVLLEDSVYAFILLKKEI